MHAPRFLRYLVLLAAILAIPAVSFAGVFVSVTVAPPVLPVYAQPICPGDGYIWTPGYWAWDPNMGDYYWVPGTWVLAPYTGALWTPGYWGWGDGVYLWHPGYWGLHIGFYGGVNYGFGYFGRGYEGGYWNHGTFMYNRTINHINVVNVHNVYEHNVVVENHSRVAFNGGRDGIRAEATPQERIAEHEQHINAVPMQAQHERAAASNRAQFAGVNHGAPAVVATDRAGRQGFQSAMAHPANPQAVQAARTAPRGNFQRNQPMNQPQARPAAPQMQQARPQPQQMQARPQMEARPQPQQQMRTAPQPQSHPQPQAQPHGGGGGGQQPHGGGDEHHH